MNEKLNTLFNSSQWNLSDCEWLLNYLEQNNSVELRQLMFNYFNQNINIPKVDELDIKAQQILHRIHNILQIESNHQGRIIKYWKQIASVAAVFLLIFSIVFFYFNYSKNDLTKGKKITKEILPGTDKAILTLADGSTIDLTNAKNGLISNQENTAIVKTQDGQIDYQNKNSEQPTKIIYNTIATPRGGKFQLTLPDGTQVWLNASSSIKFPVRFSTTERRVEVTGEVYFEVAKNISTNKNSKFIPFVVNVANKGEVQVFGTHFNINAYQDENTIHTTLFEGSVQFVSKQTQQIKKLKVGQQVELDQSGSLKLNDNPNIEQTMAWRYGYFYFNESTKIEEVLKQLSRWYDVDFILKSKINNITFFGKMQMSLTLQQIFKILEKNELQFTIEGRKIYVTEKK